MKKGKKMKKLEKIGKSWERLGHVGKNWEMLGNFGKSWNEEVLKMLQKNLRPTKEVKEGYFQINLIFCNKKL